MGEKGKLTCRQAGCKYLKIGGRTPFSQSIYCAIYGFNAPLFKCKRYRRAEGRKGEGA